MCHCTWRHADCSHLLWILGMRVGAAMRSFAKANSCHAVTSCASPGSSSALPTKPKGIYAICPQCPVQQTHVPILQRREPGRCPCVLQRGERTQWTSATSMPDHVPPRKPIPSHSHPICKPNAGLRSCSLWPKHHTVLRSHIFISVCDSYEHNSPSQPSLRELRLIEISPLTACLLHAFKVVWDTPNGIRTRFQQWNGGRIQGGPQTWSQPSRGQRS